MASTSITHPRRVILANEPRLFREMLQRAINHIPALEVVGEVADLSELPSLIEATGAQWVIVSMTCAGKLPDGLEALLVNYPSVCVLGVAEDGSQAQIEWVEFHCERLEDVTLDELLATLCTQSTWTLNPTYIARYVYRDQRGRRN